ncbi:uncharacterized protein N7515_005224 [Penicillium bovifimosum]|uniref:Nitrogen regulatory protein areA GATA-like domain-containing protein n=1 Tax=Penicillium bovifimosum TaxID=126998 RepID=A0A9W9KZY2_9EURO|nr:uncharacterized protein N7515_005224 [Penicillium bovifimosum]KAJ5129185.1 hypothetical protein N7515_005224 [Penicillium bovifimosum]
MMTLLNPRETHSLFSPDPIRSPTAQRYFLGDHAIPGKPSMQNEYRAREPSPIASTIPSAPPSPSYTPLPERIAYAPSLSSLSPDHELVLPSYESDLFHNAKEPEDASVASTESHSSSWTLRAPSADDSSIEDEPSRHVDYLSHDWNEEDIWSSWRYVTSRKNIYNNGVRLENASWRTWAKAKHNLKTISPESLNWLKDCDVTWLYGPLKSSVGRTTSPSPPPSRLETPTSYLDRKPILKKKTASETILQRSLSQHTLLQHAGAILKAQEAEINWTRPPFPRSNTDLDQLHHRTGSSSYSLGGTLTTSSSSGMASPSERRHIHFNNEVVQCIAVEAKGYEDEWPATFEDESSSDDGVVFMRQISSRASLSHRSTPRSSFSGEGKTIAPLPSTTLKYRGDPPEPRVPTILDRWSTTPTPTLSPTPSVETLRPPGRSEPPANFLLDEDEDPNLDYTGNYPDRDGPWFIGDDPTADRPLRLSASGMIMPEGESETPSSIFDRVVDTVNTARDIAHVIWNVGWRR